MRILSITSTYPRFQGDGAGSFIHSISEKLLEHGHILYVIAPDNHKVINQWQDKVKVERVKYIWPKKLAKLGHGESLKSDTQLRWYSYIFVIFYSLISLMRIAGNSNYRKADVIYAHWLLPSGLIGVVVSKLLKIPLVIHLHGSDVYVSERYTVFRPLVKHTLQSASRIIACSRDLAERIKYLGANNVEVIPYGVNVSLFHPPEKSSQKQDMEKMIIRVTSIGRLVNKKGFKYLILAAENVIREFPQCEIQIVGDGDQRDELIKLSNSLNIGDKVNFLGNVPWNKIPDILRITDIFVLPSIVDTQGNVDGLPNVLLEAMSTGCAIIATKVGGVPDIIEDGINGILIEPKNYDQLSRAIVSLLSNEELRENLGKFARETVERKFTWDIVVRRIENVLEETLHCA